jgi:hypothetical protein
LPNEAERGRQTRRNQRTAAPILPLRTTHSFRFRKAQRAPARSTCGALCSRFFLAADVFSVLIFDFALLLTLFFLVSVCVL